MEVNGRQLVMVTCLPLVGNSYWEGKSLEQMHNFHLRRRLSSA